MCNFLFYLIFYPKLYDLKAFFEKKNGAIQFAPTQKKSKNYCGLTGVSEERYGPAARR